MLTKGEGHRKTDRVGAVMLTTGEEYKKIDKVRCSNANER